MKHKHSALFVSLKYPTFATFSLVTMNYSKDLYLWLNWGTNSCGIQYSLHLFTLGLIVRVAEQPQFPSMCMHSSSWPLKIRLIFQTEGKGLVAKVRVSQLSLQICVHREAGILPCYSHMLTALMVAPAAQLVFIRKKAHGPNSHVPEPQWETPADIWILHFPCHPYSATKQTDGLVWSGAISFAK